MKPENMVEVVRQSVAEIFTCRGEEVENIHILKNGMTNRSFYFECRSERYIFRIPGEGTDYLINRRQEAEVYRVINGKGICDKPVYMDADTGYKITKYIDSFRICDPTSEADLFLCMNRLRAFHNMKLEVGHAFDIFGKIDYYESLRKGGASCYTDHAQTKRNVFALKEYIDRQPRERCLTHIDAVHDNFLIVADGQGNETVQLTDWEYAGMQDPHVDIAMFVVYAMYNREQADRLIEIYFGGSCDKRVKVKIYCYIAACGLLWSDWCEYKASLGVEFGDYAVCQYEYAKEYYQYASEEMERL